MSKDGKRSIFVFAGEQSGDLHGSHLIKTLKEYLPELTFEGVCGPKMRAQKVNCFLKMEDFEVMGLSDVLLALPKLCKNFYKIRDHILKTSPQAAILIDYPGFNLRMAKALRQKGYRGKIVQYVSPSIWAWGKHRIEMMTKTLDLLMTIYPFESAYFAGSALNVEYVGNPIQEYLKHYSYDNKWQHHVGIPSTDALVALFPGSRQSEIKRTLPILLEAAKRLKDERPETLFAVSCSHEATSIILNDLLKTTSQSFRKDLFQIPKHYTYELMRDSRSAIAKSGTVTLELALHQRPTVAVYKLTALNRVYAKHILKLNLPHYCIVNILSKQTIFPELIENELSSDKLFQHVKALNDEGIERDHCLQGCADLRRILGQFKASTHAAETIMRLLRC